MEPEATVPQQLKQIPLRAAGVPPVLLFLLTWSCLCVALHKCSSERLSRAHEGKGLVGNQPLYFGFVVLLGWSAGSLGTWMSVRCGGTGGGGCLCHTSRFSDSSCSLSVAGGELEWEKVEEQYGNRH